MGWKELLYFLHICRDQGNDLIWFGLFIHPDLAKKKEVGVGIECYKNNGIPGVIWAGMGWDG